MSKNFVDYNNATDLMGGIGNKINYEFFDGSEEEFNALPLSEKIKYKYTLFDDDYEQMQPSTEIVDYALEGDMHPITSNAVAEGLDTKQDTLTFDSSPTAGSDNPVKSSGIKTALDGKADNATTLAGYNISNAYTKTEVDNKISELVTSMSWKPAVATYADIATTYPNPQEGWTVVTTDTNIAWRYTDGQWIKISANTIPVVTSEVNGLMTSDMLSKLNGIAAGAEVNVQSNWAQTNASADDYIKNKPSDATTSTSGFMSASDKTKLNGIATGAEVNQNAFSNVLVGSTTIAADGKTDTLTIVGGSNITLTPDATNDKLTIAATDSTYPLAVKSITRNGVTFTATRYDGTTFTFTQQDNNTTTGTTYSAGNCPNNTTFGTNGSIYNLYNWVNNNKVDKYTKVLGDNVVMSPSLFTGGAFAMYSISSLKITTNNGHRNNIPLDGTSSSDVGDYTVLQIYAGDQQFMILLCISPRMPQFIHMGSFWNGAFNGWYRYNGTIL